MKISTKLFNQQTLERLNDMHGKIQQNQARIATGKNILKASDDPIAAVNISAAKEQKTENARYIENIGRAKSKLELTKIVNSFFQCFYKFIYFFFSIVEIKTCPGCCNYFIRSYQRHCTMMTCSNCNTKFI